MKIRDLVKMALYLALFALLDYVAATSGLLQMPNGGSIGLATITLVIAAYDLGFKKALLLSQLSIIIQTFVSGVPFFVNWVQFMLDYVLAFGAYAIAANVLTTKFKGFYMSWGLVLANVLRFSFHVMSGIFYWEVPLIPSIIYNGPYMLATLVITFIIVGMMLPRLHLQEPPK